MSRCPVVASPEVRAGKNRRNGWLPELAGTRVTGAVRVGIQLLQREARRETEQLDTDCKPLRLVAALVALSRQPVLLCRRAANGACLRIVLRTVSGKGKGVFLQTKTIGLFI
jgi:hypothetical protein